MKKRYPLSELVTLTPLEQEALSQAIIGSGNLKAAVEGTESTVQTIKRAAAGMRLTPDKRQKIRRYLKKIKTTA